MEVPMLMQPLLVDAKVNAGGTISIYGKPKQIKQQTFAGGTITEK